MTVMNKADLFPVRSTGAEEPFVYVSAKTGAGIYQLKDKIAHLADMGVEKRRLVSDLLDAGDFVVLVVPIDESAPKGRLILPQQQTIRDILEADATAVTVREYELKNTLEALGKKPKLVITDSQAFKQAARDVPEDILLTSFSILLPGTKGIWHRRSGAPEFWTISRGQPDPYFRRLYPPSAVRRYRNGEASAMD